MSGDFHCIIGDEITISALPTGKRNQAKWVEEVATLPPSNVGGINPILLTYHNPTNKEPTPYVGWEELPNSSPLLSFGPNFAYPLACTRPTTLLLHKLLNNHTQNVHICTAKIAKLSVPSSLFLLIFLLHENFTQKLYEIRSLQLHYKKYFMRQV